MTKIHFLSRRSILVSSFAIAAIAFTAATSARSAPIALDAPGAQEKHEKQGKHDKDEDTPLEKAMQSMQSAQKRLEKALDKKDLAAALPLVVDMERAAMAAKTETPPKSEELADAKKKAEFVAAFRKQLIGLQKALCDVEAAMVDGKIDDAARLYESGVKPLKKDGHAKFKGD